MPPKKLGGSASLAAIAASGILALSATAVQGNKGVKGGKGGKGGSKKYGGFEGEELGEIGGDPSFLDSSGGVDDMYNVSPGGNPVIDTPLEGGKKKKSTRKSKKGGEEDVLGYLGAGETISLGGNSLIEASSGGLGLGLDLGKFQDSLKLGGSNSVALNAAPIEGGKKKRVSKKKGGASLADSAGGVNEMGFGGMPTAADQSALKFMMYGGVPPFPDSKVALEGGLPTKKGGNPLVKKGSKSIKGGEANIEAVSSIDGASEPDGSLNFMMKAGNPKPVKQSAGEAKKLKQIAGSMSGLQRFLSNL